MRNPSVKPIAIRKVGQKWEVWVDLAAATAMGASQSAFVRNYPHDQPLPLVKTKAGFDFIPGGKPAKFSKEDAIGWAHKIGRYSFDFGDFVHSYTTEVRDATQTQNMAGKRERRIFRDDMPVYPSVTESHADFRFLPGEYEATHVVNGMAWRIKDEFVSPETMAIQAYYDRAARSQDQSGIKRYGKDLQKSMRNDQIKAALAVRQANS